MTRGGKKRVCVTFLPAYNLNSDSDLCGKAHFEWKHMSREHKGVPCLSESWASAATAGLCAGSEALSGGGHGRLLPKALLLYLLLPLLCDE